MAFQSKPVAQNGLAMGGDWPGIKKVTFEKTGKKLT
jgi:hypothetical protein